MDRSRRVRHRVPDHGELADSPTRRIAGAGTLLFAFEPAGAEAAERAIDLAMRILLPDPASLPAEDFRFLEHLCDDEEYQPTRRRRMPMSVTGGRLFYAADLVVHPFYLLEKHLSDALPGVPCLAEPGDRGRIRHIPYWIAYDGIVPPPWTEAAPILLVK